MKLRWYCFEYEGENVTKVWLRLHHSAERRGFIDIFPENWVTAHDELDAYVHATKWLKLGRPIARDKGHLQLAPKNKIHGVWIPE